MSLAGARLLARWCPAWKRREPDLLLLHGTWEGVPRHCPTGPRQRAIVGERERPKRQNRKGLSTVAGHAGGPARSSEEAPVTGVERRGRVIRGWFVWSTGKPGGAGWAS